ncbi:hypothetical protein MMC20_005719 [Loxospora ochrophaea]|nr:hypothetical protein [Loxospora ochrophaea]
MDREATSFQALPRELLDHIVSYLDREPASTQEETLMAEPSLSMTFSDMCPLKSLSLTNHFLRSLAFHSLFKYAKVRLSCLFHAIHPATGTPVLNVLDIDPFLSFVRKRALSSRIKGILIYTAGDFQDCFAQERCGKEQEPGGNFKIDYYWRMIMESIRPDTVTICAPPSVLGYLTSCSVRVTDAWAFDMPLHILHLKRSPSSSRDNREINSKKIVSDETSKLSPWTHCILNEGSALKAYSTYEYFHKRAPSITNFVYPGGNFSPFDCPPPIFLTSLKTLDYVAIFPFASHMAIVLVFVRALPNLERLRIQLVPDTKTNILQNATRMQRGLPSDMWMEFRNAYHYIFGGLLRTQDYPRLKEVMLLDCARAGIQATVHGVFDDRVSGWQATGPGCWRRDDADE